MCRRHRLPNQPHFGDPFDLGAYKHIENNPVKECFSRHDYGLWSLQNRMYTHIRFNFPAGT